MSDDAARRLVTDLCSGEEEARRLAAMELGAKRDPALLEQLVGALGDASWRVRKEVIEGLLAWSPPGLPARVVPGLRDGENAGRRNSVVELLVRLGAGALDQVAPLLRDPDPDLRKFAVDIAGGIGRTESVPLLVRALGDPEESVAATAAEHLGQVGDRAAIGPLLQLLAAPSFWLRFSALRSLGRLADEGLEEGILPYLEERALRGEVMEVLSGIGTERTFRGLVERYDGYAPRERTGALCALLAILVRTAERHPGAVSPLVDLVRGSQVGRDLEDHLCRLIAEGSPDQRLLAVTAAPLLPSAEVVRTMVSIIEEAEEDLREEISLALGTFPEEYLELLFPHLGSSSTLIRRKVSWIFGHRRFLPAVDRLLPLVGDEDGHVRSSVAQALGLIGDRRAVVPLFSLLRDPYPDVRQSAVDSLGKLAKADPGIRAMVRDIVVSTLDTEEENLLEGALKVLASYQDAAMTGLFTRFLKDARVKVRRAALRGLGLLDDGEAREIILSAFADEDAGMRLEAIRSLGSSGRREFHPAIMAMVRDGDDLVAAEVLKFLGRLATPEALELLTHTARTGGGLRQMAALRALINSPWEGKWDRLTELLPVLPTEGKREVITSLGQGGGRADLGVLLGCVGSPEWSIRLAAVEAIRRLGDPAAVRTVRRDYLPREQDSMVRRAMEALSPAGD
jgi:HEAT repeat protein